MSGAQAIRELGRRHRLEDVDRVHAEAARIEESHKLAHSLVGLGARASIDEIRPFDRAGPAEIAGQRIEDHQRMGRAHRTERRAGARERERIAPEARRRVDPVGPPGQDLRRGVDRQRPLPPLPEVARIGRSDARAFERLALRRAGRIVEWRQAALARDLTDMRMIDDDEIVAPRKVLDRIGLEVLQRALVPRDRNAGRLAPELRTGDKRVVAAWMAPGHPAQDDAQARLLVRLQFTCKSSCISE